MVGNVDEYIPTEEDIQWTRRLLRLLADNAMWGAPGDGAFYRVDKKAKVLYRQPGSLWELHGRVRAVFGKLGYRVEDGEP